MRSHLFFDDDDENWQFFSSPSSKNRCNGILLAASTRLLGRACYTECKGQYCFLCIFRVFMESGGGITTLSEKQQQHKASHSMQAHFDRIEVVRTPVCEIRTPPFVPSYKELIKEILTAHGAEIAEIAEITRNGQVVRAEHIVISFPDGTYRSELLPRTHDEKYRIVFPDGYSILEIGRRGCPYSYLQFDTLKGLNPEQVNRLKVAMAQAGSQQSKRSS
jgi:uncharacterized protein (DUF1330 family)